MPPRTATVLATTFGTVEALMVAAIAVQLLLLVYLAVAETAINRISKPKADALAERAGKRGQALADLVSHPESFMNPVLVTVNILQTGQAFLTSILVTRLSDSVWAGVGAFALNVIVLFVATESLPKTFAVLNAEPAALAVARPTRLLARFLPLRALSGTLIGLTNWIFPGKGLEKGPFVSERELLGIVEAAAQDEVIEHDERELIESIIEFGDTLAREVMVPRTDMVVVGAEATVSEALDRLIQEGHSRAPVVGEHIDEVVGLAHVRDLFQAERADAGAMRVSDFCRPAHFFPETKPVRALMREMQGGRFHLAMLVDEHGGIAGLVTLEDLIEELVGDIEDEYDDETPEVEELPNGELRVDAGTDVDELSERIGVDLPNDEWDTVAGLVLGLLGRVPEPGEEVTHDGHRFVVEAVEGRRIVTVRVVPPPAPDAGDGGAGGAGGAEAAPSADARSAS